MATSKQTKIAACEYAIKGIQRAINSSKKPALTEIYEKELLELEEWRTELKAAK